jgi:hypothetical protein
MIEISNKQCPSNLSDIATYQQTLTDLATKCTGKFEVLYKVDLLKNNATIFKTNLTKAANDKLTACQYAQCNLTASEISSLTNRLSSSSCKDGCAGKTGSQYDNCFSCLQGVFHSCGIPSNKIDCLVKTQKEKDEALQKLAEQIIQEQDQHVEEEIQEGIDIMEQIYQSYEPGTAPTTPAPEIGGDVKDCKDILGTNLTKIVRAFITIIQIAAAIIAIVKGMMILIPPIIAKDADALKKASSTLIILGIVLIIVLLFRPLVLFLGKILELDISCLV